MERPVVMEAEEPVKVWLSMGPVGLKASPYRVANLCDFAYGHNISELIQAEMLECKGTTGPRERLHFIENDGYPRFT